LIGSTLTADQDIDLRLNYFGNISASKLNTAGYDLNDYSHNSVNNKWNFSPYSRAGLQVSVDYSDFTFTAQSLMKKGHSSYEAELTWLNVKYNISDHYTARLGRIQTKVLLYSESLDINNLQLWSKPPVEVYRLMPVRTYDGVELAYDNNFADYHLNVATVGFASYTERINGSKSTDLDVHVYNSYSLALTLGNDIFTYKASYSETIADIKDDPSTKAIVKALSNNGNDMSRYTFEDRRVEVYSLGFKYRYNAWNLDTELVRSVTNGLLPSSTAAYVILGYKVNDFTPYMLYAENKNDESYYDTNSIVVNSDTESYRGLLNDILYLNNYSQSTFSLGTRYDIEPGMALNFQIDRLVSTNYGSISSQTVTNSGYEKVGILSRDAGISDKAIYAFTTSLNFAY
jgi:hypothetical protein